ncbi:hypothetical protein BKA80DRAFT_99934 [Phyllosticta citrichinensis]
MRISSGTVFLSLSLSLFLHRRSTLQVHMAQSGNWSNFECRSEIFAPASGWQRRMLRLVALDTLTINAGSFGW